MNETSTLAPLIVQSLNMLRANLVPNTLWIILGFFGIIENSIVILVIVKSKELRSTYYMTLAHLSGANVWYALTLLCVGFKRDVLLALGLGEVSAPWRCAIDLCAVNLGLYACIYNTVAMAVDRIVSVVAPVWKKNLAHPELFQLTSLAAWLLAATSAAAQLAFLNPALVLPTCNVATTFSGLQNISSIHIYAGASVATVLYVVIVVIFHRQWVAAKATGVTAEAWKAKAQYKATQTSLSIVIFYAFAWLLPTIASTVMTAYFGTSAVLLAFKPYIPVLYATACVGNFPIFLLRNGTFREELMKLACMSTLTKMTDGLVKKRSTTRVRPAGSTSSSKLATK